MRRPRSCWRVSSGARPPRRSSSVCWPEPRPCAASLMLSRLSLPRAWRGAAVTATAGLMCLLRAPGCPGTMLAARSALRRRLGRCLRCRMLSRRAGSPLRTPGGSPTRWTRPVLVRSSRMGSCWPRPSRCRPSSSPRRPSGGLLSARATVARRSTDGCGPGGRCGCGTAMTAWCICTGSSTRSPGGASAAGSTRRPTACSTPTRNRPAAWPAPARVAPGPAAVGPAASTANPMGVSVSAVAPRPAAGFVRCSSAWLMRSRT